MVDFKKALERIEEKQGYCNIEPALERGTFIGTLTHLATTGKVERVKVKYKVYARNARVLLKIEDGPTGYEEWAVKDLVKPRKEEDLHKPWCVCGGTEGRWDNLTLDRLEDAIIVARRWANFEVYE